MNVFKCIYKCVIVLINLGYLLACYGDPNNDYGVMTPDFTVRKGNSFELNCTLTKTTIKVNNSDYILNSSMIFFKHHNKSIDNKLIHIHDQFTSSLFINQSQFDDSGNYYCYIKIPGKDPALVCLTTVHVGEPPAKIGDDKFWCQSLHFENLTCTWIPKYTNIRTNYYLSEIVNFGQKFARHCPNKIKENSCQWTIYTYPPYRHQAEKFIFLLTSNNTLGKFDQYFYIDHYDIIKPDKPKEFSIFNINATSITVDWQPPRLIEFDVNARQAVRYQLLIKQYNKTIESFINKQIDIGNVLSYSLVNLIPHTIYEISLRCRISNRSTENVWSEYVNITTKTKDDIPYDAPELLSGTYESIETHEGHRNIIIYWNPVANEYYNGERFRYVLFLMPKNGQRNEKDKQMHELYERSVFFKLIDLKVNAAYQFKMYSKNDIGISTRFSFMYIDEHNTLPEKPREVSAFYYGNGHYEVMWDMGSNSMKRISGYTIYYCSMIYSYTCSGPLKKLKTIESPNIKQVTFNISSEKGNNYQFAVSSYVSTNESNFLLLNKQIKHSSLVWSSCIVPIGNDPIQKVQEFRVEIESPTTVKVFWNLACKALQTAIEKYEVHYCESDSFGSCIKNTNQRKIIDNVNDVRQDEINNLKPNRMYRFTIRSVSSNTKTLSEESDSIIITTVPGAPSSPLQLHAFDITRNSMTIEWLFDKLEKIDYFDLNIPRSPIKKILPIDNCTDMGEFKMKCQLDLDEKLKPYSTYKVSLKSCVKSHMNGSISNLCSPTETLEVQTKMSNPGVMEKPFAEAINQTTIRISWKPPTQRNGPINLYRLSKFYDNLDNETESIDLESTVNYYDFEPDCDLPLSLRVQAINIDNKELFISDLSEPTMINGCLIMANSNTSLIIGLSVGAALAFALFIFLLVSGLRWIKRKVDEIKAVKIQLPDGLQHLPFPDFIDSNGEIIINQKVKEKSYQAENDHNTIDSYEFATIYNKRRQNSGTSHLTDNSTDGLLKRMNNKVGNDSGHSSGDENSANGITDENEKNLKRSSSEEQSETGTINGHESVASELTYTTHVLSIDSGTADLVNHSNDKFNNLSNNELVKEKTNNDSNVLSFDLEPHDYSLSQPALESFIPKNIDLTPFLSTSSSTLNSSHYDPNTFGEIQFPPTLQSGLSSSSLSSLTYNSPLFTKTQVISSVPAPPVSASTSPETSSLSSSQNQATTLPINTENTDKNPYINYKDLLNFSQNLNMDNNNDKTIKQNEIIQPQVKMNSNGYVSIPPPSDMTV